MLDRTKRVLLGSFPSGLLVARWVLLCDGFLRVYRHAAERTEPAQAMACPRVFELWSTAVLVTSCMPIVTTLLRYDGRLG